MATRRPLTNVEFLTHMMNHSQAGALKQAFILEAIRNYSKDVIDSPPWADGVISYAAWLTAAQECLAAIENRP